MKKHILKLAACVALSLSLFSSCNTDAEGTLYEESKTEYAFASTFQKTELLPSDGNKFIVPVYRNTKNGSGTVSVSLEETSENAKGVFGLETPTVTFEAGESIAEVVVSYDDINKLSATDIYEFTLSFAETEASPSKVNSIKVSAQRKLTFKNIGTGVFTSTLYAETKNIDIEKAEEADIYRLLDVYQPNYPLIFSTGANGEVTSFKDQETGWLYGGYYMTSVHFIEAKKEGNTYHFTLEIFIPGIAVLGTFVESLQLPNRQE